MKNRASALLRRAGDAKSRRALMRALADSGLVDLVWYAALVGQEFTSVSEAVSHYASTPAGQRRSLSPLLLEADLPQLRKYFAGSYGALAHPVFGDRRYVRAHPHAAHHPGGPRGHFVATAAPDSPLPVRADWAGSVPTWRQWREAMIVRAAEYRLAAGLDPANAAEPELDWEDAAAKQRISGRVSVIIPTFRDWKLTAGAVNAVIDGSGTHDVQTVVVENGLHWPSSLMLDAAFALRSTDVVHRKELVNRNFANGENLGFLDSDGDVAVFLNNDTQVLPGWLDPLVDALDDPLVLGAQPLLLYADGTIQTAGTVFPGQGYLPGHLLASHPPEDAEPFGDALNTPVVTAACLAMRAADVISLRGFDDAYVNGWEDVDLCLRAGAAGAAGSTFRVMLKSRVIHSESKTPGRHKSTAANRALFASRWLDRLPEPNAASLLRQAGFEVTGWDAGPASPDDAGLPRPAAPVLRRISEPGRLRWAIKIAAPAGPAGDHWGDTFFARDLADALRSLGQTPIVDRVEAHHRSTEHFDDVALVIRGLDAYEPAAGPVAIEWIISHPDAITAAEVRRFDAVFAASAPWAASASQHFGVPIEPLLQATAPHRFHPGAGPRVRDCSGEALFVGSARTRSMRPIVRDALAAKLPLAVYGPGWEQLLPEGCLQAEEISNELLPAAYANAGFVLSDHHSDMAAHGFMSNRLFDAVACGARVISDDVAGTGETFGGSVLGYSGPGDLAALCSEEGASRWPDAGQLALNAASVAREHSFDNRAQVLLDCARELIGLREAGS